MTTSSLNALPGVGAPATRALQAAGYVTLNGLAGASRADLAKLHGVGPKALRIIEEALKEHGFALRYTRAQRSSVPLTQRAVTTAQTGAFTDTAARVLERENPHFVTPRGE